jgi:hypothetical protein
MNNKHPCFYTAGHWLHIGEFPRSGLPARNPFATLTGETATGARSIIDSVTFGPQTTNTSWASFSSNRNQPCGLSQKMELAGTTAQLVLLTAAKLRRTPTRTMTIRTNRIVSIQPSSTQKIA